MSVLMVMTAAGPLLSGAYAIGMIRQPACHAGDDSFDLAKLAGQDGKELLVRKTIDSIDGLPG